MTKFDKEKAKALAEKIIDAEAALSRYLGECFPIGERCHVILKHGQINPTPAEIVAVSPNRYGGVVHARIDTAKPYSRRSVRIVSARNVTLEGGAV